MAEPRTVLYVDHARGLGGAEHSLLALLDALDRDRFRPLLAAPSGPLAEAAAAAGVAVRQLPLARLQRQPGAPLYLARGAWALRRLARDEGAALLHGNVLRASIYASLAAAGSRPFVWHVRDLHPRGPAASWLCRRADAVLAISRAVAAALPCRDRAELLPNPVSLRPARPRSRAELGLPTEGPLAAMVASLRPWKGHASFLDAAARLRLDQPDARFVLVGGAIFDDDAPGYEAELRARAAGLGLADRVTFLGQRSDTADLWPHFTLLCHPAVAEPFGRVVAEAQLAGVPVVAFRDGGLPELIEDGQTGLLVPPGDLPGLAAAMARLLAEPELRADLARRAARRAAARYAPAAHARAVERVYERLPAGDSGRRRRPAAKAAA